MNYFRVSFISFLYCISVYLYLVRMAKTLFILNSQKGKNSLSANLCGFWGKFLHFFIYLIYLFVDLFSFGLVLVWFVLLIQIISNMSNM